MNTSNKSKILFITTSLLCFFMLLCQTVFAKTLKPSATAEWNTAEVILMQPPSIADFWISIFPKGNGYDTPFDYLGARSELLNYIKVLRHDGIKVYTVENVLLEGTIDQHGKMIPGKKLNQLRTLAKHFLKIKTKDLNTKDQKEIDIYINKTIASLSPQVLVKLILQNPILIIKKDPKSISGFYTEYSLDPLIDLFYLRDQIITTPKGIVVGKFAKAEVSNETEVIKFVLKKLGIKPIYEIQGNGALEGGDFFMANGITFIGEGVRTNAEGIKQLMDHNVIGTKKVIVVKDHLLEPAQMHLDTYFNLIAPKLAVLSVERMLKKDGGVSNTWASTVDVYEFKNGHYVLTAKNKDFKEYLEKVLHYKVIPVSIKDQRALATNFLTIAPYKIVGPEGASQTYKNALKKAGVNATWVDMNNIVKGFGAARCTTQPIKRTK